MRLFSEICQKCVCMHRCWADGRAGKGDGGIHLWLAAEEQVRTKRRQNRTSPGNLSPPYCGQLPAALLPAAQTRQPSPRQLRWRHRRPLFHLPRFHSVMGKAASRFRARWYLWPHRPGSSTDLRAPDETYVKMELWNLTN